MDQTLLFRGGQRARGLTYRIRSTRMTNERRRDGCECAVVGPASQQRYVAAAAGDTTTFPESRYALLGESGYTRGWGDGLSPRPPSPPLTYS